MQTTTEETAGAPKTIVLSAAEVQQLNRLHRRREAIQNAILARLRRILVGNRVLSDAEIADEWQPLAAMLSLRAGQWGDAERLRDAFIAAILPELRDSKEIRVQYARIISLLNHFLHVHCTPYTDRDSWPTLAQIEEDF
jgi:hypothetical protein